MDRRSAGSAVSPELVAVGQRLKAARELRHLTLESVEEATHIRQTYLRAIEEGRADDVPGEVFLKGFLRTYANHLGLDGSAILEGYKQAIAQSHADVAGAGVGAAGGPPGRRRDPSEDRPTSVRRSRPRRRGRRGNRNAWWMVALIIVVLSAWAAAKGMGRHATPVASPAPAASGSVGSPARPAAGAPSKSPGIVSSASSASKSSPPVPVVQVSFDHTNMGWQDSYVITGATGLQITISASAACWTRRWVDGSSVYSDQTLAQSAPETVTWTATKTLKIWIGNAPGIASILVNGQPTRALPPQGADASEWLNFSILTSGPGA